MSKKIKLLIIALIGFSGIALTQTAMAKSYLIVVSEPTLKASDYTYNYNALAVGSAQKIEQTFTNAKTEVIGIAVNQPNVLEPFLQDGYDLIIMIGNDISLKGRNIALDYPEQKFAFIDFGEAVLPDNACAYQFDGAEAAFLAGFIAANMTDRNKLGFVGGLLYPQVQKMGKAFALGARHHNPDMRVEAIYVNDFFDIVGGRLCADQLYSEDIEIIFHAAGLSGHGVIESAREHNRWVIGVDADQYPLAPENVLTSVIIDIEMAILAACYYVDSDTFEGGQRVIMNLANGGVRLGDTSNVPPEILEQLQTVRQSIVDGDIVIDKTLQY